MPISFEDTCAAETHPDADGVTGLAVLAVNSTGVPFIEKYYGRRSAIGSDKIDSNSAFWIYSITKTITAIAALQCVERGEVQLDKPIYDVLPELKDFGVLGYDQTGNIVLKPHKEKITLRHLLSHTSGVGVDLFDPRLQAWRMSRDEHPQAFSGDSKKAYTIPLLFEPGQGWAYGGGVEWAGIAVERLTRVKLGEYMKKNIFDPLGMTSTTFHPDKNPDIQKHLVETSTRISDGTLMMYGRLTGEPYDPEKVGQAPGAYFVKKDTQGLPGGTLVMTGIPNLVWFVNRDKGVGGLYASAIMPPDDAKSTELIAGFLREVFNKD
ncbi:hypothetical protein K4K59_011881 [Colletotrichum sp. SAR11_240]|nr:hypothetical protein K4K59_011881 [Colletotrichum sp. SAR11_240]